MTTVTTASSRERLEDLHPACSASISARLLELQVLVAAAERITSAGVPGLSLLMLEEALDDLTGAIQAVPDRASAIASRGETHRALNRAIELDTGYAWAIGSRGQIYRVTRRYEEAPCRLQPCHRAEPGLRMDLGSRGQTCHDMGRYEDVVAVFSRAIELNHQLWLGHR